MIRFNKDPKITGSSSFDNLMHAEQVVSKALEKKHAEIASWLKTNPVDKKLFEVKLDMHTGVKVLPNNEVKHSVNGIKMMLKPCSKSEVGYTIWTAYPN